MLRISQLIHLEYSHIESWHSGSFIVNQFVKVNDMERVVLCMYLI